jgi:hypothetical protein
MRHSRHLRTQRMHALEPERVSPAHEPAIMPSAGALAARPKRDNLSECLQALEASMNDLSSALADLLSPCSEGAAARRASARVQFAESSGSGDRPSSFEPRSFHANETVAAIAMVRKARWSHRPEPAILSPAAPRAHTKGPQIDTVGPKRENAPAARGRRRALLWSLLSLLIPVAVSAAFYLVAPGNGTKQPREAAVEQTAAAVHEPVTVPRSSAPPLPSSYGVYAISKGELHELEALPFKAPDPRIRLSAEITKPSSNILPDGHIVFAVFRRELLGGAPQKAAVRVVARVARRMTFEDGKAISANVQNAWRIRSDGYDFNVAPLGDNHEMVALRPEAADLALPAGRYALIFAGLAYDFTVDGPVTDRAHCLETVMAANGLIYIECRSP